MSWRSTACFLRRSSVAVGRRSGRRQPIVAVFVLAALTAFPASVEAQTPQEFFNTTGAGGRAFDQSYGEYWLPHIEQSRRAIQDAAASTSGRARAVVLGAGKCREIPLEKLAEEFQHVILVDLDKGSMEQAVRELPPPLQAKVEVRVSDVTSFVESMMADVREAIATSRSADEAFRRIESIYAGLPRRPKRPPELPACDLVISSLVLSELHRYPLDYAGRLLQAKFSARLEGQAGFLKADQELTHFAVADHVALLRRLERAGGAIYFADTIARGPDYNRIGAEATQTVLMQLLPEFARDNFFQKIQEQPAAWQVFAGTFSVMRAKYDPPPQEAARTEAALKRLLSSMDRQPPADRAAVAESMLNLLCHGYFPARDEVRVLERLMETYERTEPAALRPSYPLEMLQSEWARQGLSAGAAREWWWLAYPPAIAHDMGAFQVRSWTLHAPR